MRVDCKFYESRTYASGETVRMCRLDLAPEAPWRCPEACTGYQRRMIDVGWQQGSLQPDLGAEEPPGIDLEGAGVADLLEHAEEILNAAGAAIVAEEQARKEKKLRKRKKRR